ncbi:YegP family protein [Deinococcus koreensis]|uniref:DUF1508 domain-containing protein n=1 Tax=Deinococcus koreensis TaxID=2054903 RepID=A0A2K3UW34_9DEIO|nr:YegP family protein [Deinococcus koreensis]PNY80754.1 hypothetical protein CVO96_04675 [Deinococcus koreensis]
MAGKYVLKTSGDQFMFNLHAGNGQIVLTSERYASRAGALGSIASVQSNAGQGARYEPSADGLRFDLRAANGQAIGHSEAYSSADAARSGMDAVKRAAEGATTDDQT